MKYRTKMGELPGDIPRQAKIRMLESRKPFDLWPHQHMGRNVIRSYRQEFIKIANRRLRRERIDLESDY